VSPPFHVAFLAAASLVGVASAVAQTIPTDEAGFTTYVADRLRKELSGAKVNIEGPLTIVIGSMQANLDRVYSFCGRNRAGCANEVNTYVKAVVQAQRNQGAPPTKEAVRLVVRTAGYLEQSQKMVAPSSIQAKPLVDGLFVVPVLNSPRSIRVLTEKDSAALGLNANQVHELGIANLRKTLKPLGEVAKVAGPQQIGYLDDDFFHPSRLVLLNSWAPLAKEQGGVLIVAAPATDFVAYIGEDTTIAVNTLRLLAEKVMSKAPSPLSNILLRWTPKGWQIVR
jgi:hypothetical protein